MAMELKEKIRSGVREREVNRARTLGSESAVQSP